MDLAQKRYLSSLQLNKAKLTTTVRNYIHQKSALVQLTSVVNLTNVLDFKKKIVIKFYSAEDENIIMYLETGKHKYVYNLFRLSSCSKD